jgi:hypothetical protein
VLLVGAILSGVFLNQLLTRFDAFNPNELAPERVSHWSGYIVNLALQNKSEGVSSVSGSWIVPKIVYSVNDTYSSVWVGIGGYGEQTLIQAGTEQHCENGKVEYFAWYELLPRTIIRVSTLDISPGDKVTTTITLMDEKTDTWRITVVDQTEGKSFQKTVSYESSMKSAEWIVERPMVNGEISTLADFDKATLTDCSVTINGVAGSIKNFTYTPAVMADANVDLVHTSSLNSEGSSFTITYLKPNQNATVVTVTQ